MSWFKRVKEGILTRTEDKKEAPDGIWVKCPKCKAANNRRSLTENSHICKECDHHFRIGSKEYFQILFGDAEYEELLPGLSPQDPLEFEDSKPYPQRIVQGREKSGLLEAIRVACGKVGDEDMVVAVMDFRFVGGSMGSVMGEKLARGIDRCIEQRIPLLIISKSGGARMQEGAISLMQMAKVSANLTRLAKVKVPYFSLLTDPTTGGVTASFAMLGDLNIAEPGALIGFAGPRVIKETIGKDLPKGFQTSEFVKEHGFLDFIVDRRELKDKLVSVTKLLK